jgi:AMMECR1 domain-containing protein
VEIEISVLSPLEQVAAGSEQELLEQLVPGEHGLLIAWRGMRATFLPKVWEQLPDPREFLRRLKLKAGWPADFWAEDVAAWRYGSEQIPRRRP